MSAAPTQNRLRGIAMRLAGAAMFAIMASAIKLASARDVGAIELIFYRNLFALPIVLAVVMVNGGRGAIATRRPAAHATRGVIGLVSMGFAFQAVLLLPLAEATTIGFAAPLFATLLSTWLLGERVGRHRWAALAVGFAGVIAVMQPYGTVPRFGHIIALVSAFGVALVTITIRQIGATESAVATVFWFNILCVAVTGLVVPFFGAAHDATTWALLAFVGVTGGCAQFLMTQSLRLAPVSVIAPFDYTQILWATLLGWLIWRHGLSTETIVGAVLVIASGLYTVQRERRRHLAGIAANATAPLP